MILLSVIQIYAPKADIITAKHDHFIWVHVLLVFRAVLKHHDQRQFKGKDFVLAHGSRG